MNRVIFQTKTELPLEAITVMGINAKPNSSSPIGSFGTGLKYAIAVLVRTNHKVTFHIGKNSYVFYTSTKMFRDKEFQFISCKQISGGLIKKRFQLPFTTELGKYWELWQVFRELHSNTLDEGGTTMLSPGGDFCIHGYTTIEVEGQDFVEEFSRRHNVFLPEAETCLRKTGVQVVKRKSDYVYYRGIRIAQLQKPSLFTYNIWDQLDLTEDRTAKYDFYVRLFIANEIMNSEDQHFIVQCLQAKKDVDFEGNLDYSWTSNQSATFINLLKRYRPKVTNSSLGGFYSSLTSPAETGEPSWLDNAVKALEDAHDDEFLTIVGEHRQDLLDILKEAQKKQER